MNEDKMKVVSAAAEAKQAARDAQFVASPLTVVWGFAVSFFWDMVFRNAFFSGGSLLHRAGPYVLGVLVSFATITLVFRLVSRPRWKNALRYTAALMIGFILGDVAYAILFMG